MYRAILLAALSAVAQAQVPHTLQIDQAASAFTWDGDTSLGAVVGVPDNNFNLSGTIDLDITEGSSKPIDSARFTGADAAVPDITGEIPGLFGVVLATIELEDLRFTATSSSFNVGAAGSFTTTGTLTATQGTLTVTPLVGSQIFLDLTGLSSDPTAISGSLTVDEGDVNLNVPINFSFDFADPGTGITGTFSIDGTIVADALCDGPQNYCVLSPNSVGPGAQMSFAGTNSVSSNDLLLLASGCPPGQFGLFFFGTQTNQISVGDGTLCLGGTLVRLPAVSIDVIGIGQWALDLDNLPGTNVIQAGETRYFGFWYRDPSGGPVGYNFSDGLEVQFCL